jgi:hypothetical protein
MVLIFGFGQGQGQDLGEVAPIAFPICQHGVQLSDTQRSFVGGMRAATDDHRRGQVTDEVYRLAELHRAGVLTDEEFAAAKAHVIRR